MMTLTVNLWSRLFSTGFLHLFMSSSSSGYQAVLSPLFDFHVFFHTALLFSASLTNSWLVDLHSKLALLRVCCQHTWELQNYFGKLFFLGQLSRKNGCHTYPIQLNRQSKIAFCLQLSLLLLRYKVTLLWNLPKVHCNQGFLLESKC